MRAILAFLLSSVGADVDVHQICGVKDICELYPGAYLLQETTADDTIPKLKSYTGEKSWSELVPMQYARAGTKRSKTGATYNVADGTFPDVPVYAHSEQGYNLISPRFVAFHYIHPADEGGVTHLFNLTGATDALSTGMKEKLIERGITYQRNFRDCNNNPGGFQCWQFFFKTDNIDEIQLQSHESIEVINDGELIIFRSTAPAFDIVDNHLTLFNNFLTSHAQQTRPKIPTGMLPYETLWGGGEEFSEAELDEMNKAYMDNCIYIKPPKGSTVFIDNHLWGHGRGTYSGERKVTLTMYNPKDRDQRAFTCYP